MTSAVGGLPSSACVKRERTHDEMLVRTGHCKDDNCDTSIWRRDLKLFIAMYVPR